MSGLQCTELYPLPLGFDRSEIVKLVDSHFVSLEASARFGLLSLKLGSLRDEQRGWGVGALRADPPVDWRKVTLE